MQHKEISEFRNYKVVKANELIQKSRFTLQLQEQKIILYLISKIKPEDIELKEHVFQIRDFCKICGLEVDSGANYRYIRQTLKDLRDKSMWITLESDIEVTLSWFDYVKIDKNSGAVSIKISEMMKPYLLLLQKRFTQYDFIYILAMKSAYSIRLYELLKSYEFQRLRTFDIEELKKLLSAENYIRFADFKRRVLDVAMEEISRVSDIITSYSLTKDGKKYVKIQFTMREKKEMKERLSTWKNIDEIINPEKKNKKPQ